ncbi:MAG: hypothetical protein ACP5NV_02925 [Candidatus Woesearchaeota archaeon]
MNKSLQKKAQISMEYILITAFSLLVAIPLAILFFQYSQSYNDDVTLNQADKVMDEILNAAQTVRYLGEPSQKTITVYLPKGISGISFNDGYFYMTLDRGGTPVNIYRTASINFTGNISATYGLYKLKIKSVNQTVDVSHG